MTREDLAQQAGVSVAFVAEAEAAGLVRPEGWGYRPRLVNWLAKLHRLRAAGMAWEEIQDWPRRRFQPGHEHERRWPAAYQPERLETLSRIDILITGRDRSSCGETCRVISVNTHSVGGRVRKWRTVRRRRN